MAADGADTGGLLAGSEPLGDLEGVSSLGNVNLHVGEALREGTAGALEDDVPVLDSASDWEMEKEKEEKKKRLDFGIQKESRGGIWREEVKRKRAHRWRGGRRSGCSRWSSSIANEEMKMKKMRNIPKYFGMEPFEVELGPQDNIRVGGKAMGGERGLTLCE